MEFILRSTQGEVISVADYGKGTYLLTVPVGNGAFKKFVVNKEDFKRMAKAS